MKELKTHRYDDMVQTTRLIGSFFLTADYTKYALGFCQLASMAELAVVIRQSVRLIKRSQRNSARGNRSSLIRQQEQIAEDHDAAAVQEKFLNERRYKISLWAIYITCCLAAIASLGCGAYQVWYTLTSFEDDDGYTLVEMT